MAGGREPAMLVASVHLGPFVFGPNTLWLGLHGLLMLAGPHGRFPPLVACVPRPGLRSWSSRLGLGTKEAL